MFCTRNGANGFFDLPSHFAEDDEFVYKFGIIQIREIIFWETVPIGNLFFIPFIISIPFII